MKNIFFVVFTILFNICCKAQFPNGVFSLRDSLNEIMLNKVVNTSDNGFAMSGWTWVSPAKMVFFKMDSIGNVQISKLIGDSDDWYCNDIIQTLDGGYLLSGDSKVNVNANANVIKLDSSGNIEWSKEFIGFWDDVATSAIQLKDSNYIIVGCTNSVGFGDYDLLVIKLNKSGNLIWTKEYGGTDQDEGMKIINTHEGGYIISGSSNSLLTGQDNLFLMKFDNQDNLQWSKTVAPLPQYAISFISGIIETYDFGFACIGSLLHNQESDNIIIRLDSLGNIQWSKVINDSLNDYSYGIIQSNDSGFVIVGNAINIRGHGDVMKLEANGEVDWNELIGDTINGYLNAIAKTSDGNYLVLGSSSINGNIIAKIGANGFNCLSNSILGDSLFFHLDTAIAFQNHWSSNLLERDTGYISNTTFYIDTICKIIANSIDENENQILKISIYPNPTSNYIYIKNLSSSQTYYLQIFNSIGDMVYVNKFNGNNEYSIKLNWDSGIYFVEVFDGIKTVVSKLIIK